MSIIFGLPPELVKGHPVTLALEYIARRDEMIERNMGAGNVLLGAASKPTQLEFIRMCNEFATRFADQFPHSWNLEHWERFSRLNQHDMSYVLIMLGKNDARTLSTLTEWEGCSELSKTYVALLRQRETPV